MSQSTQAQQVESPPGAATYDSSRWHAAAAGWTDCVNVSSLGDLYRPGYTPPKFSWLDPRLIWQSRNDRIARWFEDPVPDERRRWVAAQHAKGVDRDLVVRTFADRDALSFFVIGDPGEGDESQYHVVRPLLARKDGIDFTYICSDVIYPAGSINEYRDKFYWPYRELHEPIYGIPGNHDWYDGLSGFMAHLCDADSDLRPDPAPPRNRLRRWLRERTWRKPDEQDQELLDEMRGIRPNPGQPGPYFAIESRAILLVGLDTGIKGDEIDAEQGRWLREISARPGPKILLTGKPLVVDAHVKTMKIAGGGTVNAIVDDPKNGYIAVIGGDIHNYQRYSVEKNGRTVQHLVSGAAGAYTKATHKIPEVKDSKESVPGCDEDRFRAYPRRADSLAAYSRLYDQRFGLNRGVFAIDNEQARSLMKKRSPRIASPLPTDAPLKLRTRIRGRLIAPLPGQSKGPFHRNFSELLDWNEPPPPLFKSFLRIDVSAERIDICCWAATGCVEHQDNPPLEDWLVGRPGARRGDPWEWEVKLNKRD